MATSREAFDQAFLGFLAATRRARARAARTPELAELPLGQYQLLDAVARVGQLGTARIAEEAGIAQPTATRGLASLEAKGYIRRSRRKGDGRGVAVSLTASGRPALERRQKYIEDKLAEVYESLSTRERDQGHALLSRLSALIDSL